MFGTLYIFCLIRAACRLKCDQPAYQLGGRIFGCSTSSRITRKKSLNQNDLWAPVIINVLECKMFDSNYSKKVEMSYLKCRISVNSFFLELFTLLHIFELTIQYMN